MSGKAKNKKTFGKKIKDQSDSMSELYSLHGKGTIMASTKSAVTGSINNTEVSGQFIQVATTDLNMKTYDIIDVDRLKFASESMETSDPLTSSDYGIEALYTVVGGVETAYGMQFRVPATKKFYFNSGATQFNYSDTLGLVVASGLENSATFDGLKTNTMDFALTSSPTNPSSAIRLFADVDNLNHLTIRKSDGSEIDLETLPTGANTALGNLAVTTDINSSLIPNSNDTKGLGTNAKRWASSYVVDEFTEIITGLSTGTVLKCVGHFRPFDIDTWDLGGSTNYWRDLYITGDIHFKDGDDAKIAKLATGLQYEVPSGDLHRFQVIGDTKLSVSASSIGIEGGLKVVSLGGVEIGFQVTNTAITIGDAGTMQIPYKQSSTNAPSDSVVDSWFGDANGCIGIQYYSGVPDNHRFWFKSDGGWVKTFGT